MTAILALLLSPVGRALGIAVLGIGVVGFFYVKGHASGVASAMLRIEREIADDQRRQARAVAAALEAAQARAIAAKRESEANRQRADDLADQFAVREPDRTSSAPGAPCPASSPLLPSDAEKLNAIR